MESCFGIIHPRWASLTLPVIAIEVNRGAGGTLSSTLTSDGVITSKMTTSLSSLILRVSGLNSVLLALYFKNVY